MHQGELVGAVQQLLPMADQAGWRCWGLACMCAQRRQGQQGIRQTAHVCMSHLAKHQTTKQQTHPRAETEAIQAASQAFTLLQRCAGQGSTLLCTCRRTTPALQLGHSQSPSGIFVRAGLRQRMWKPLKQVLHSNIALARLVLLLQHTWDAAGGQAGREV